MALINIGSNLDQVEIKDNFQPLPTGEYTVQVQGEPEYKEPKAAVNAKGEQTFPYLNWRLAVVNHPDYSGRLVFHMTSLKPEAMGFKTGLKAMLLGLGGEWDAAGNIDTAALVGRQINVILGQKVRKDQITGLPTDRIDNTVDAIVGVQVGK